MPCSSQIISEMLPEIHTMEKCYFLKSRGCHFVKVLSTTVGYSLVAMVTDLLCHLTIIREEHCIQNMPCSSQIISEIT